VAFEGNPVRGAFGKLNFLGGVTVEGEAGDHGMFEARAEGGFCFVEIANGNVFLVRSGAYEDAVDLYGRARWRTGDD
jgi:hypothetical protein